MKGTEHFVSIEATMESRLSICWDVRPCNPVVNRRF
jgi:hypothetical protein